MINGFSTPVLLLGFNRTQGLELIIQELRTINAKRIFFSVDGPRLNNPGDEEAVEAVRNLRCLIDWDCQLEVRFLEDNLGCKLAVSSAIDWFFDLIPSGIILEDDCVPVQDFFYFCEKMLKLYENNPHIMHISGSCYSDAAKNVQFNHYFSSLTDVWGWATWKHAWDYFELEMPSWSKAKALDTFSAYFKSEEVANWFYKYYYGALDSKASVWATQWGFAIIKNRGLSVVPTSNLVKNIGFNSQSTHATNKSFSAYSNYSTESLKRLPNPKVIEIDYDLDNSRFAMIKRTDPIFRVKYRILAFIHKQLIPRIPKQIRISIRKIISKTP